LAPWYGGNERKGEEMKEKEMKERRGDERKGATMWTLLLMITSCVLHEW
jgi:hypothetical protein